MAATNGANGESLKSALKCAKISPFADLKSQYGFIAREPAVVRLLFNSGLVRSEGIVGHNSHLAC